VEEILERVIKRLKEVEEIKGDMLSKEEIAHYIDHTLLRPETTEADIRKLCEEAAEYRFFSVCVNPCYVRLAKDILGESDIKVSSVVGFPLGANKIELKEKEAELLVEDGTDEIDMVANIGKIKDNDWGYLEREITRVVNAVEGRILKVIIETALLSDSEKIYMASLVKDSGARFVKTSTGFLSEGATPYDVALLREAVGEGFGVKASGGIRTYRDAITMIRCGATRIGSSKSVDIVTGA